MCKQWCGRQAEGHVQWKPKQTSKPAPVGRGSNSALRTWKMEKPWRMRGELAIMRFYFQRIYPSLIWLGRWNCLALTDREGEWTAGESRSMKEREPRTFSSERRETTEWRCVWTPRMDKACSDKPEMSPGTWRANKNDLRNNFLAAPEPVEWMESEHLSTKFASENWSLCLATSRLRLCNCPVERSRSPRRVEKPDDWERREMSLSVPLSRCTCASSRAREVKFCVRPVTVTPWQWCFFFQRKFPLSVTTTQQKLKACS